MNLAAADQTLLPVDRLRRELERPPFNRWLAAYAVSADEAAGEIRIALPYRPEFSYHASQPIFHGGVIAALIDVAGYAAVAVWHGGSTPTVSMQVEYLAPATGPELVARGMLRRLGRSISRADVEIVAEGKLVALGRGTFATGGSRT